ncbi:DMT family transporter [Tissierella sp. MSJ-40]|uniref:DMT family transporter n=1 Tax=Tissierella simiarum TaxID=2841534 RepID=A0ABS6E5H6_9FIRM|nr:EamA family transporter [Tissierella simiarum]MBU5438027.1 DMT family transporter [Tissierella simiarum]
MKNKKYLPILSAIISSTIFGFSFMFTKIGLEIMTPIELISFRFLLAAIVMTLLKFLKIIEVNLKGKNIKMILLASLCEPVLYFIFEVTGINMTTSSEAGLMISIIPVFVTIFSIIFLKEKPRISQLCFIGLSVFGVIFINMMKDRLSISGNFLGIIFLFLAIISSAGYNIASKKASEEFKPLEITFVMMWVGAIAFNSILTVNHLLKGTIAKYFYPLANIQAIIPLFYLGILSSVAAFFMVNYTISKIPVSQSAVFANLSTIVSIVAGVLILKEDFYWFHVVGSIMILIGVWGTVYYGDKSIENKVLVSQIEEI